MLRFVDLFVAALCAVCLSGSLPRADAPPPGIDFTRLAALRTVGRVAISPDGARVAYTLNVPRRPGVDDDGPAWVELHVAGAGGGPSVPYVTGAVNVGSVRFTPDGSAITYLAKREGDEHKGLWSISVNGGESRKLLEVGSDMIDYRVAADGRQVAFIADEPESEEREEREEQGYKQRIVDEDWRPRRVWIAPLELAGAAPRDPAGAPVEPAEPRALEIDGAVFSAEWVPGANRLVVSVAPTPLIDDRYMLRRIRVVDADTGRVLARLDNPGKMGHVAVSPDGARVALISAADANDPREGRLWVAATAGGAWTDRLPGLEGHVRGFVWQDARTLLYLADVGVETELGEVDVVDGRRKTHLRSGRAGVPLLDGLQASRDGRRVAFVGESPTTPPEAWVVDHEDRTPRRLSVSNPWLDDVALAAQEVVRFTARDGLELEGLLLRPLESLHGSPAPLILIVHGGPESHFRNGWISGYSRPGQLAAARGYAVFYPNYRGSTGRGVAFSKLSQGDAAGREFDDLVDAVDHLIATGVADRERVGVTGGSYGGYATAWCATRFSERFRAGVMFVGISNKVSKAFTTEIPNEDRMVHTLYDPWAKWDFGRERSPLYHVENGRTALLIAHGADDPRVHPSQSLQLYRAMRLLDRAPVRLVLYPGEGHGNRKAAARDDFTRRLMRWMDHFLVDGATAPPPYELAGDRPTQP